MQNLSIFEFMHKFGTIPAANLTYIGSSQNHTNNNHGIQTFEVVVVVLLFLYPQMYFPDVFGQLVCLDILKCQIMLICRRFKVRCKGRTCKSSKWSGA